MEQTIYFKETNLDQTWTSWWSSRAGRREQAEQGCWVSQGEAAADDDAYIYMSYIIFTYEFMHHILLYTYSNTSINDSFSSTPMSLLRILDIFCISVLWFGLSNIAACCWILIISRMDLPQWWRRWNGIKLTWWRSFAKSVRTWKSATRKVPQKCAKQRLPKNTSRKHKVTPVELVCMRISHDFRVS